MIDQQVARQYPYNLAAFLFLCVTLGDDEGSASCVGFILQPDSAFDIEYEGNIDNVRETIEKLARVLGYQIARVAR